MIRRRNVLLAGAFGGMLPGWAFGQDNQDKLDYDGDEIVLRWSTSAPDTIPAMRNVTIPMLDEIERDSGGKIKIKRYFSGTLHGARDGFKAVTSGITDWANAYAAYSPSSFHLAHGLDLPFAFPNGLIAGRVAHELYAEYLRDEYEKMGVYLGGLHFTGAYNLFTKKPIKSLAELKGMKIRASGAGAKTVSALGGVPTSITAPEMYSAFQRGTVDGVLFYPSGAKGYKVNEIAKYMLRLDMWRTGLEYAFSKEKWDAFPTSVKQYLAGKMRKMDYLSGQGFDVDDEESTREFVEAGMIVNELSDEEKVKWKESTKPVWDDFVKSNEKDGYDASGFVARLRSRVEYYEESGEADSVEKLIANPVEGILPGG